MKIIQVNITLLYKFISKMSENSDLVNAKEKLISIIKKYGSLELLRKERNQGSKKAAVDRRKIDRLKKKIQCIEERNGIITDTEELKYKEHCMKVKTIIGKYQSINVLKDKRKIYRKSKKRKYKDASNDLRNYNKIIKNIRRYEEEKEVKSSEKFEIFPDYMSMQESRSTNEKRNSV